jgi:hypothetical protein
MQEVTEAPASEAPSTQEATASTTVDTDAVIRRLEEKMASGGEEQEQTKEAETQATPDKQAGSEAASPQAGGQTETPPPGEPQEVPLTARQQAALFRQEQELRRQREELKKQQEAVATFRERLRRNPTQALKEMGIENAADVAAQMWNEALGDKAPEEFKRQQQAKLLDMKAEEAAKKLEEYEQRMQQAVQQAEYNMRVQTKDDEIKTFMKDVPQDLKFVKRQIEKDPQSALQLFYNVAISQITQGNWGFSARDIAKALDDELQSELSNYRDLFSEPSEAKDSHVNTPRKTSKTLTNSDSVEKPDKKEKVLDLDSPDWTERGVKIVKQMLAQQRK